MNLAQQTGTRGQSDAHARAPEYAPPLSALSIRIGQERLCADCWEIADFIAGSEDVRELSDYFGSISVPELVTLLFKLPTDSHEANGVLMAAKELRRRLLEDKSEYVLAVAQKAEEA